MLSIITIRTDKPEAEIGLYKNGQQVSYHTWPAHRQLAETIHQQLKELLQAATTPLEDLSGIVVFKGPGSFTGLRIGLTVANALADGLHIPIVATTGEQWITEGMSRLDIGENEHLVLPEYGSPPHITAPRK